ncbi:MAG: DUF305 domain-containing protein [Alphaproteobacteria bacterium]|nr:DUF305 domain-containing protein [Alphaproteobacteria bacterium]
MGGGSGARADDHMTMDHSKMDHSMMQKESDKMAVSDNGMKSVYDDAMMKMHENMAKVAPTGDADIDFVTGMIPHHQGAIDMAKIEVEKGKDPEIKKLAQDIIKAQEKEIEFMNKWLEKNHPAKH